MGNNDRTAIVLVNFNMKERADALAAHIQTHIHPSKYSLILVDNGSDQMPPAERTTIRLRKNRQTCGGWLAGLDYADFLVRHNHSDPYFAYWIMITSAEFVSGGDILTPMVEWLAKHENAVAIHPALTQDSTTAWEHLKSRGLLQPRRTWMIDNIAALYKADWFDNIGRFDPALTYAWGTDLETCWLARKAGRSIWVDERGLIKKVTNIGYTMDRMGESAEDRVHNAYSETKRVLMKRYGKNWEQIIRRRYVIEEWL